MIFLADELLHLPLRHWDYQSGVGFRLYLEAMAERQYITLKFVEAANGGSWQVGGVSVLSVSGESSQDAT